MRLAGYLFTALILTACHSEKNYMTSIMELQYGCFGFSGDGKTVTLQITEMGESIKGNLNYHMLGKEPIEGNFEGLLEEDLLIGTYTYRLGGMESSRGMAFQVDESGLLEGQGILNADGSSFQNPHFLSFSTSKKLKPCECPTERMANGNKSVQFYSQIKFAHVDPIQDGIILQNISKTVSLDQDKPAFLIFNKDQSIAEIFFHDQRNSLVLNKSYEGNWSNSRYTLSYWKNYTLYHETSPIFVGKIKSEKDKGEIAASEIFTGEKYK